MCKLVPDLVCKKEKEKKEEIFLETEGGIDVVVYLNRQFCK